MEGLTLQEKSFFNAALYGKHDEVQLFIKNGMNVNLTDPSYCDRSALHIASERNDVKMIELLISFGADISLIDEYGQTPLLSACYSANTEAVVYFIEHTSANIYERENGDGRDAFSCILCSEGKNRKNQLIAYFENHNLLTDEHKGYVAEIRRQQEEEKQRHIDQLKFDLETEEMHYEFKNKRKMTLQEKLTYLDQEATKWDFLKDAAEDIKQELQNQSA